MEATGSDLHQETSQSYVGRWNRLVSTTNWEKGRIVYQWRQELIAGGAPPTEYSDEAWSRRVGRVSSQHVGRLRRVWERFGESHDQFDELYWSHFQVAHDWEDAEMWLEGAVQNGWSVSQMRHQRWETIGAPEALKPREEDIILGELDEDFELDEGPTAAERIEPETGVVQDAGGDAPSRPEQPEARHEPVADETESSPDVVAGDAPARVRPFADLVNLPPDLGDALEAFKLAILQHKLAGWSEVSLSDVLASLEALKQLALAPSDGSK